MIQWLTSLVLLMDKSPFLNGTHEWFNGKYITYNTYNLIDTIIILKCQDPVKHDLLSGCTINRNLKNAWEQIR